MPQKNRSFAVIGLQMFGATVARELARFDNYVLGIDIDEKRVNAVADDLPQCVIADPSDEAALRDAGLADCDVVLVAISDGIEPNVLATINARTIGVETIWAKAISRAHHRILMKIGADRVVHPEEEVGRQVAQMLHNPFVRDFVSVGNGYHVVNFIIPDSLQGRRLSDLDLAEKFDLRCVGVMRGTDFIGQDGMDCELSTNDRLLLLGTRNNLRDFGASL